MGIVAMQFLEVLFSLHLMLLTWTTESSHMTYGNSRSVVLKLFEIAYHLMFF